MYIYGIYTPPDVENEIQVKEEIEQVRSKIIERKRLRQQEEGVIGSSYSSAGEESMQKVITIIMLVGIGYIVLRLIMPKKIKKEVAYGAEPKKI